MKHYFLQPYFLYICYKIYLEKEIVLMDPFEKKNILLKKNKLLKARHKLNILTKKNCLVDLVSICTCLKILEKNCC